MRRLLEIERKHRTTQQRKKARKDGRGGEIKREEEKVGNKEVREDGRNERQKERRRNEEVEKKEGRGARKN